MEPGSVVQLVLLACLAYAAPATGDHTHLMTSPHNTVLEIGKDFTATCTIINTSKVTADDLYWVLGQTNVSEEQYTRINESAISVTIRVSEETPKLLFCVCKKNSSYVQLNQSKFQHGIVLKKGYTPEKPENLSCITFQDSSGISRTLTCDWKATELPSGDAPISYTLFVKLTHYIFSNITSANKTQVTMDIYPNHIPLEIWVEAHNVLARIESEHLFEDANSFVKTNPPSGIQVFSEKTFASSLLINWTPPIPKQYMTLMYQIRFCPHGSQFWNYVPLGDIAKDMQSFRLQNLRPYTNYSTQLRCKYPGEQKGYWSEWSATATQRTPEDRPSSKPDLWRIIIENGGNERRVQFLSKDPVFANGNIEKYAIRIQDQKDKSKNGSSVQETVPVSRLERDSNSKPTLLREIWLPEKKSVKLFAAALNSVGSSPEALLGIPAKVHEHGQVQELKVWPDEGHLQVEWKPSNSTDVTEYVVEWVSSDEVDKVDWQRESKNATHTTIKGTLRPFVCYSVSVYPVYFGWIGKAARAKAYVEEGVLSDAPEARLQGVPGRNEATVVWTEIPERSRRGFITHYTLYCRNGAELQTIRLAANTTSYKLTSLSANTKYEVWIAVSTIKGSKNGSKSYFTTLKYAPGEIEGIMVGVSLGFLFVFLLTMLLCIYKKDTIKENFWPQIPNPGESTIGNWSPDYSLKAETPKENGLSGISVLDVDMCDTKCVFEEDKASLALKKDKYQSEEHSSGIGGSSCMSSPRQSVSDSDEDTTASTVQYSSVVASSGYKGQTPGSQAQQAVFSRSESTQPLLDLEENPDVLVQEGSRPFQRYSRKPRFPRGAGNEAATADSNGPLEAEQQDVLQPLDFCPMEDDAEEKGTAASGYMPQLGGYRPQ